MSAAVPAPTAAGRRLGAPHFAHLRGVLQGVDLVESARRYLGADTADDAREAHADTIAAARGLATRQHKAVFRHGDLAELFDVGSAPAIVERDLVIDRWAQAKGIDVEEWNRAELIAAFETEHERSAADIAGELAAQDARARLERQLRTLRELQDAVDIVARPEHLVSEWFDAKTSGRLLRAGVLRLDELQRRIAADERWYKAVEAIGAGKAAAIAVYLGLILPALASTPAPSRQRFTIVDQLLGVVATTSTAETLATSSTAAPTAAPGEAPMLVDQPQPSPATAAALESAVPLAIVQAAEAAVPSALRESLALQGLDGRQGTNRKPWQPGDLPARTDVEAIVSWLRAKVGAVELDNLAPETGRLYEQQALRLMLWCVSVRGIALSSMESGDCEAYMAWLTNIPPEWISRGRSRRWDTERGWAPFASQLNRASRQLAITIVSSMFAWLVEVGYLRMQPWKRVKLKLPDDKKAPSRVTRAFTPAAWEAIVAFLEREPVLAVDLTPARVGELRADWERMRFVVNFNVAVGLRGTELVTRTLDDFKYDGQGRWRLSVFGKGGVAGDVAVPGQALRALDRYLRSRGLSPLAELSEKARKGVPLIGRADDHSRPIGYRALADSFRAWVQRAMDTSSLPMPERELAMRATTHWLRHTMATIADERGASETVLQEQLRHRDPRTTKRYIHARGHRAQEELDRAFS